MAAQSTMMPSIILLCCLLLLISAASSARVFPQRSSHEAAIIEWGHSAIISALDGAVAAFGPQTSMGASFEVETAPVLARPINGVGDRKNEDGGNDPTIFDQMTLPALDNAADVMGNMVIMTDDAGLSGVAMARIAKMSGAAALMIVNTDRDAGDYIFSVEAETEEEAEYAADNIDIPVFMVSLQAGNVITTALATDDMDPDVVNSGGALPDRVRLYAGGDRPFFEDVVSGDPLVYLIHNMLTADECDGLVSAAEGMYDRVDDASGENNYLENLMVSDASSGRTAKNIDRVTLWKGGIAGKFFKDIDEREFIGSHCLDSAFSFRFVAPSFRKYPHADVNEFANAFLSRHCCILFPQGFRRSLDSPSITSRISKSTNTRRDLRMNRMSILMPPIGES